MGDWQDYSPGDRGAQPAREHRRWLEIVASEARRIRDCCRATRGVQALILWTISCPLGVGVLLALVLCTHACGYRFTTGTGQLPAGGTAIAIPVVDNRTPEVAASPAFTAALRDAAWRAGLTVSGEGAQLQGTILSIIAVPRGVALFDGQFRSREQEIIVEVKLRLDEQKQPPWERVLVERVSYLSGPDLRDSEANRLLALRTALRRLADRGIDALVRKF